MQIIIAVCFTLTLVMGQRDGAITDSRFYLIPYFFESVVPETRNCFSISACLSVRASVKPPCRLCGLLGQQQESVRLFGLAVNSAISRANTQADICHFIIITSNLLLSRPGERPELSAHSSPSSSPIYTSTLPFVFIKRRSALKMSWNVCFDPALMTSCSHGRRLSDG